MRAVLLALLFATSAYALTGSFFQNDREYGLTDEFYSVSEIGNIILPENCTLVPCSEAVKYIGNLTYSANYFICGSGVVDANSKQVCSIIKLSGKKYVECGGSFLPENQKFRAFVSCPIFPEGEENATEETSYLNFTPEDGAYYCAKDMNDNGIFDNESEIQQCIKADNGAGYVCPIDKVACEATYEQPLCPEGTLNTQRHMCQADATVKCPRSYTWDSSLDKCVLTPACPDGGVLNTVRDRCEKTVINECPEGYTYDSVHDICVKNVDCGDGVFIPERNRCEKSVILTCPAGYTLVGNKCVADPSCSAGTTYNSEYDKCVESFTKECPSGYTYNDATGRCEAEPICPSGFTYNAVTNRCETRATVSYNCPSGTYYNSSTGKCEATPDSQSDDITASVSCSSWGYDYNECSIDGIDEIKSVKLQSQTSDAGCRTAFTTDTGTALCSSQTTEVPTPGSCFNFDPKTLWWCSSCSSSYNWLTGETTYTCNNCQYGIVPQYSYYSYRCSECEGETNDYFITNYKCSNCQSYLGLMSLVTTFGITSDRKKIWVKGGCRGTFEINGSGCPIGYTHYTSSNICVKCPIGTTYNSSTGKCETNPSTTYSCPSGSTLSGTLCIANPSCPSGGTFDGNADICWTHYTPVCPDGITYDSNANLCVATPTCSSGTLNPDTDKCELVANADCGGWTYDSNLNVCYSSPVCSYGLYDKNLHKCAATVSRNCGTYAYDSVDRVCYAPVSCPTDPTFPLSDTIGYSAELDKCVSDAEHICPSRNTYTYTWNSDVLKCELIPICKEGVFTPETNGCYVGDLTCPVGDYPCMPINGKNYCSPNPCEQWSSALEYDDTQEGANDKQADGQVDENGNCLGTIYVFNGNDYRCRPPGLQTGGSNCCKKTTTWFGLGQCNEREKILAKLRSWGKLDGQCHYVGSYCAVKVFKLCIQKKKTYCCFHSVLARIIQEQGRQQLGIDWGSPKSPNCRGFTPEEFQRIDFSKIDFSEWYEDLQKRINDNLNVFKKEMPEKIQNYYENLQKY